MLKAPLIDKMRNNGASDGMIAKAFPETVTLGHSKATKTKYFVEDKTANVSFETRVAPTCCGGNCMQPVNNCKDGLLKGNLCAQISVSAI